MDIFNCKFQSYINTLSENKRFKYTIKNDMCLDILNVLKSKETNISPKFKFWVKKTFHLVQTGSSESIYVTKKNYHWSPMKIYLRKLQNSALSVMRV